MNKPFRVLIAAVLFVSLSGLALAQEGKDLDAFLQDDSPALLFQVDQLTLEGWGGGIGMMFSASENVHWRIAFSPRFSTSDESSTDSVYGPLEGSKSTMNLALSAGPMWVLYRKADFCFTAGPELWYGYNTSDRENSDGSTLDETGHVISLYGTFGAGYAIAPGFLIHAEYRLGLNYIHQKYNPGYLDRETSFDSWSFGSSARLGLVVRL